MIELLCGLFAYVIVMYGFAKALNKAQKVEAFIEQKLKMPWLNTALWWLFPFMFLWTVISLVHTVVPLIDPSIQF
jgi:Ca2+/Na+ antiporter